MNNYQSKPNLKKKCIQYINSETASYSEAEWIVNYEDGKKCSERSHERILVDNTNKSAVSFFTLLNDLFEQSTIELSKKLKMANKA